MELNKEELKQEQIWSILCYMPLFNIITCLIASIKIVNSKIGLFHVRQGIILFGCVILTIIIGFISPTLSLMFWGINILLHTIGIYYSYFNKIVKIPIISNLAVLIPEYYFYKKLTGKTPDIEISENKLENHENDDILGKQ